MPVSSPPAVLRRDALVVFDLDGTLIDSLGDLADAVNRLVAGLGGPPLSEDAIGRMIGEGALLLVSRAFAAAGIAADPREALPRFAEIYESLLPGRTVPYDGVPTMLEEAARRARLAVVTNKPTAATHQILSLLDLDRHFETVIGGDGEWPRKPDPAALRHLIGRAGLGPNRVVMVGDSVIDLRTGQAAGVRTCLVRYGFGRHSIEPADLRGDEWFIEHPAEFDRVLDELLND